MVGRLQVVSSKHVIASRGSVAVNSLICSHVEEGQLNHTWVIIFDLKCHHWISTRKNGQMKITLREEDSLVRIVNMDFLD